MSNRQLTALRNRHIKLLSELSDVNNQILAELIDRYGASAITTTDSGSGVAVGGSTLFCDGEISAAELDRQMIQQDPELSKLKKEMNSLRRKLNRLTRK